MVKKIAVYYRTSKDSKNKDKLQKYRCTEFCKKNKLQVIKEYQDLNVSGLKRKRVALNKLMEDSNKKDFSKLLVYNIDRLGRRYEILREIDDHLAKNNIELVSATQKFDDKTPEGKFVKKLFFIFAEYESDMISRRIKDGIAAKNAKINR